MLEEINRQINFNILPNINIEVIRSKFNKLFTILTRYLSILYYLLINTQTYLALYHYIYRKK